MNGHVRRIFAVTGAAICLCVTGVAAASADTPTDQSPANPSSSQKVTPGQPGMGVIFRPVAEGRSWSK